MTNRLPEAFDGVKTWIFDCDGVITSEERYFDAAGLTVREVLESPCFLGLSPPDYSVVPEVFYRRLAKMSRGDMRKYLEREFIVRLKARGLNSNWDLAYVVIGIFLGDFFGKYFQAIENEDSETLAEGDAPGEVLDVWRAAARDENWREALRLDQMAPWGEVLREQGIAVTQRHELQLQLVDDFHPDVRGLDILEELNRRMPGPGKRSEKPTPFGRPSPFWTECQMIFQEWYLGAELFEKIYERPIRYGPKPGLIYGEEPLLGHRRTRAALEKMSGAGCRLGIATGRPAWEVLTPFEEWDVLAYFDRRMLGTHDRLEAAEAELEALGRVQNLSKPDPFVLLRAVHPDATTLQLLEDERLRTQNETVAFVGDTVADIWAGQAAGCPTVAVLSGVTGVRARKQIEEAKPDLIVADIGELAECVTNT